MKRRARQAVNDEIDFQLLGVPFIHEHITRNASEEPERERHWPAVVGHSATLLLSSALNMMAGHRRR